VTPIDSDTPAGRRIEGILRTPIRDRNGTILAPRGAKVKGRIVRLARHFATYDYFELAVRLESVEVGGVELPLRAALSDQPPGPLPPNANVGYDRSEYPKAMQSEKNLPASTGEFFFVQERIHLRAWDSEWMTQLPESRKKVAPPIQLAPDEPNVNQTSDTVPAGSPENPAAAANVQTSAQMDARAPAAAPQNDSKDAQGLPPEFRLRVESNLVLVRVAVRDSQENPIHNLKKEDFQLFDKGKRQDIAQFEVVSSPQESLAPAAKNPKEPLPSAAPSPAHPSFLALYFDDLNTSDADIIDARDAASRYLGAGLPPNEQVAIFTSSGPLGNFTNDPKQIQTVLANLRASPRRLSRGHECPELTDFQAQQINQFQDDYAIDAWRAAIEEVKTRCPFANPPAGSPSSESPIYNLIRMQARQLVDQAQVLARTDLQQLEQVVRYLARLPGQRTVVLVSPGFLSESEQVQLDRIIDRALREQVVVSALDPKGLALLMREIDVTRSYAPSANSGVIGATHNVDFMRESAATDVMAELADGTGGKFFHNNNDLVAGFRAVSGSTTYYILAFVPGEFDGKFHKLEVKLPAFRCNVQARRGYFAVRNAVEATDAESTAAQSGSVPNDDLQRMMSLRDEMHDLAIEVSTEVVPSSDTGPERDRAAVSCISGFSKRRRPQSQHGNLCCRNL
jgi:VWFA-related protein